MRGYGLLCRRSVNRMCWRWSCDTDADCLWNYENCIVSSDVHSGWRACVCMQASKQASVLCVRTGDLPELFIRSCNAHACMLARICFCGQELRSMFGPSAFADFQIRISTWVRHFCRSRSISFCAWSFSGLDGFLDSKYVRGVRHYFRCNLTVCEIMTPS